MRIEKSAVEKITISELDGLDPVSVMVESKGYGKASVVVTCWDKSWNYYWGSMGGDVKDFFSRVNVSYLINCFGKGISYKTDLPDTTVMGEVFTKKIKQHVIEKRRCNYGGLNKEWARYCWEAVKMINFESICPEHDHECFNWKLDHDSVDSVMVRELFGYRGCDSQYCFEEFNQWLWDNIPFEYEDNPEYHYLKKILTVVKTVLSEE